MSKVLLWSPPLWARTAYSKDMLNLALELMKAGHDVKNFALTGLAFGRVDYPILECPECGYKIPGKYEAGDCPRCGASNWQRYIIDVLPNNSRDYGQSWLPKWNMLLGPFDLVILHYDAWVMGGYKPPGDIRLAYYSPVDHSPCPPPLANVLKAENVMVIVMSRFGQKELKKAGISSIYIPHTVDTKMFSPGDRIEARKRLELPEDSCLFAAICTNKGPRKNWGNLLRAFRDFLVQVPRARENSFLFAHTNITASEDNPRGFNLTEIWHSLGIEERIKHTHPIYYEAVGFTDEEMCDVYRSADWTLLTSLGEGFGLPIIESLASGTPVIYSDFSSCPEVAGQGGLPVKAIDRFPFELSSSFQWVPSTKQITKRLIQAYEDWENGGHLRDELAKKGRQHVLQNYTWDKVRPLWLDLIKPKISRAVELLARNEPVDGEVDIIVITHNKLHLLKDCIESIYRETKIPFHLVVVDDQSDDGTPKHMRKMWRERGNVSYIKPQDKAKGGAQIMNIGLKYCRNDRIVSMNNDIVVTDGWLEESIKVIESDPTIGIVGMKFLYSDNKIQHAGGVFIKGGLPYHLGIGEPRQTHSEIKEAPWVSGPCVLLRRQCLEPGWNEDYDNFGGHEDIDLCLRARKQGWKVMYCGKSEVYHLEGETVMAMPNFWQMHIKSRQVFLSKWGNTPWVK